MTQRMTLDEAKKYWFGDDLTVCAVDGDGEFWAALPKREVVRGLSYIKKLESCQTIEQSQAVYEEYASDIDAPKLLPWRLINFMEEADRIVEFLETKVNENSPKYLGIDLLQLEKMNNVELYGLVKEEPFNLYESRFYRDESDMNVIYGQASLVTDSWIPLEIAESVGVRDEGTGFFYETVEYLYPDFSTFSKAFTDLGFEVEANSVECRKLLGY